MGKAAFIFVAIASAAATAGVAFLFANIAQRKHEARETVFRVSDITEQTVDPKVWGANFPRQYDGYIRTADNERTRFGGSEALPENDDRPEILTNPDSKKAKPESKLRANPRLKTIFNGYAFALDYRERRGHAFMLHDQLETERVKQRPQPGACLNCHASVVVPFREAGLASGAPGTLDEPLASPHGQAQLFAGFDVINKMPYADAVAKVEHPVACVDCHDPDTMALRITRPAFINGIQALAKSDEPVPHLPSVEQWRKGPRTTSYDPSTLASRQEMRTLSCAQCHVEYYFKGEGKTLTFPWHKGLKAEQMEAYYDEVGWSDWTHKDSGAKVIKAQHPEFETWSQGIHARSGVSCADCHMPYTRQGAIKVSDHQIRSPMLNVARACQTCHNYTETEIKERVDIIQSRTKAQLDRAEIAVVDLIRAIQAAAAAGATDADLAGPRALQRRAQWRTDLVNAENSMGFHAPQETMRLLGEAIDFARQGEVEAAKIQPAKSGG